MEEQFKKLLNRQKKKKLIVKVVTPPVDNNVDISSPNVVTMRHRKSISVNVKTQSDKSLNINSKEGTFQTKAHDVDTIDRDNVALTNPSKKESKTGTEQSPPPE